MEKYTWKMQCSVNKEQATFQKLRDEVGSRLVREKVDFSVELMRKNELNWERVMVLCFHTARLWGGGNITVGVWKRTKMKFRNVSHNNWFKRIRGRSE